MIYTSVSGFLAMSVSSCTEDTCHSHYLCIPSFWLMLMNAEWRWDLNSWPPDHLLNDLKSQSTTQSAAWEFVHGARGRNAELAQEPVMREAWRKLSWLFLCQQKKNKTKKTKKESRLKWKGNKDCTWLWDGCSWWTRWGGSEKAWSTLPGRLQPWSLKTWPAGERTRSRIEPTDHLKKNKRQSSYASK